MRNFILRQNIRRFRDLLSRETNLRTRVTVLELLRSMQRELALVEAAEVGAFTTAAPRTAAVSRARLREFVRGFEASPVPCLILDPGPGLHIVDMNDAYARATMIDPGRTAGERMFDVFPDNPDDSSADGVDNLYRSLCTVAEGGRAHRMHVQRYDVRDGAGVFVEKHWSPQNKPIFDDRGDLMLLMHEVRDVTAMTGRTPAADHPAPVDRRRPEATRVRPSPGATIRRRLRCPSGSLPTPAPA